MKKTFDQLLQEIWEANNVPDLSNEIKVAILQLLAPDFVSDIQGIFEDHDDNKADELEEKLQQLFCIDDRACETYDREFDFGEWVENAEGPPTYEQLRLEEEQKARLESSMDYEDEEPPKRRGMKKLQSLIAKIEAHPDKTITRREIIEHYWKGTYSERKYHYLSMATREGAKRVFMSQSLAPGTSLPWQSSDGYLLGYLKRIGRSTYRLRNFHDRAEALGWIQKLAYTSGSTIGRRSLAEAFRTLDPYDVRYYYMVLRSLERGLTKT